MCKQFIVFIVSDGGKTITALGVNAKMKPTNVPASSYCPDMNMLGNQGWYNALIIVDQVDANTLYIGGSLCSAKSTYAILLTTFFKYVQDKSLIL